MQSRYQVKAEVNIAQETLDLKLIEMHLSKDQWTRN